MTAIQLDPVAVTAAPLLRAIAKGGWATRSELAEMAGRSRKNMARDLKTLANAGLATELDDETGIVLTDHARAQLDAIDRAEGAPSSSNAVGQKDEGKPGSPDRVRFPEQVGDIRLIPHSEIRPDPANARADWDSDEAKEALDALRQDIIQAGLLQNLVVRESDATDGDGDGVYTLVGGERRWRAIGLAIFDDDWPADRPIPCRVINVDALGQRLAALSENLQRRDLNPLEKARAFDGLAKAFAELGVEDSKINREIADRIGVTIEHIQQTRSLLKLDADDQERLALAKDDPRRLKVSDARKAVADAAKADAARAELLSIAVEERLAVAEILHAISDRGRYSYDDIVVRAGAADTDIGRALAERNWANFKGPITYGENMGHYGVARGQAVPGVFGEPYWTGTAETRDAALRAHQAEAGYPARTDYVTEWLNGPFDLTEEGQALLDDAEARRKAQVERETALEQEQEARLAEKAAAAERQRVVAIQSRDLFAAHRITPAPAEAVVRLAAAADAKLPWRMKFNGDVVAADGEAIIGGRTNDRAEARMRLLILAVNAAGGVETPEDEPDPNPTLTEEEFLAAMAADLAVHDVKGDPADILAEFLSANGVAYGEDGWEWTAEGAHEVCMEAITAAMEGDDDDQDDADPVQTFEDAEVPEGEDEHETSEPAEAVEPAEGEGQQPAVPIRKSITPDFIVCLEDGRKFKSLKRHLRTRYNLSPEDYRAKWGLAADYPMVAPNYAKARADLARQMGLGVAS